ncbi:MAG TPA: hypothetical protein VK464_07475 [Symbiobacteriaceae bacterium]|nr:hypothetical protein [Symbiobacteriaceae bacterium]
MVDTLLTFAQLRRDVRLLPYTHAAAFEDEALRTEVLAKAGQIWLFRVEGAPNARAWRLYERLGFRRVQTMGIAMSEAGR